MIFTGTQGIGTVHLTQTTCFTRAVGVLGALGVRGVLVGLPALLTLLALVAIVALRAHAPFPTPRFEPGVPTNNLPFIPILL